MEIKPEFCISKNTQSPRRGISRRQMVQWLIGATNAGFVLPGVAISHPIHKHLTDATTLERADAEVAAGDWKPKLLDPHQNETLTVLAERIVPGSIRAQVNRFIDLLLSVDTPENQEGLMSSLSAIDDESIKRFGQPFKGLSDRQRNDVLTFASTAERGQPEQDTDWAWFRVPAKPPPEPPHLRDHFENLKQWIVGAYYSSEVGMRELGWTGDVFFATFPGCTHSSDHR